MDFSCFTAGSTVLALQLLCKRKLTYGDGEVETKRCQTLSRFVQFFDFKTQNDI